MAIWTVRVKKFFLNSKINDPEMKGNTIRADLLNLTFANGAMLRQRLRRADKVVERGGGALGVTAGLPEFFRSPTQGRRMGEMRIQDKTVGITTDHRP